MERTHTTSIVVTANTHEEHDQPSILAATLYGSALTAVLFSFLGVLIGNDRAPGSYYAYGLSCFFWPVCSTVLIGAVVGGSLGWVFGWIGHASAPVAVTVIKTTTTENKTQNIANPRHLTLHLPRH